jgi:hypothetical protein
MDFGEALKSLKQNKKVTRKGWNGKGMYIEHQILGISPYAGDRRYQASDFLIIVNKDRINTWVPSVSDLFADDWEISK